MGLLHGLKRSVAPPVWAALEAVHPAAFWRLRHRKCDDDGERELILAPLLCSSDAVAVDVGSADGAYATRLCKRARRVIAFEAQPRLARRLAAVAKAESLKVQVENVALSDRSGSITLRVPRHNYGRATVEEGNALDDLTEIDHIEVPTRRLDDYDLDRVGFMKIDVEGHELSVLRGAEQTIRRGKPILLMELEDRHHPHAVEEANRFLSALGYRGYFLTGEGMRSMAEFDVEIHQARANTPQPPDYSSSGRSYFNNFLFCTPDKETSLRQAVLSLPEYSSQA